MQELKQSTAITLRIGPFLDETDGITPETALTLSQADYRLSKAGGAFAQKNDVTSGSHDENGWYTCVLDATDTGTLGLLEIAVHESGALPVWRHFMIVTANVWDSKYSTDKLEVDVVQVSGDTTAADNLEADYDGTGYNKTNSEIGTVAALTANNDKTDYGLSSAERTSLADAIFGRDLSAVAGAASRSLLNAVRYLRNRVAVSGGTLTVYQEDDSTTAWTASVTTTASNPISEIDPT